MVKMDDIVAVGDIAEIERRLLGAQGREFFLFAEHAERLIAAKNFRIAQDAQPALGPDKSAQQRALEEPQR